MLPPPVAAVELREALRVLGEWGVEPAAVAAQTSPVGRQCSQVEVERRRVQELAAASRRVERPAEQRAQELTPEVLPAV